MKEQIYTIPINEAFEKKDGCPVCRLAQNLENDSVSYVMGAAMMEPDIRIETNKLGFCHRHFEKMLSLNNRLSMGLILESHLPEICKKLPSSNWKRNSESSREKIDNVSHSCYVCSRAGQFMKHYYENIIYLWKNDPAFRDKFSSQPYFCLPHHSTLLSYGEKALSKQEYSDFFDSLKKTNEDYLSSLQKDVSLFCKSFDYRFSGIELGEAKSAVERAALFLSGNGSL